MCVWDGKYVFFYQPNLGFSPHNDTTLIQLDGPPGDLKVIMLDWFKGKFTGKAHI